MLNERQSEILSYITEHGEAKNSELLDLIGECSNMTLWRDLARLEQEGHIERVRGGAIAIKTDGAGQESSFACRARQNISAKGEISRIAADLIHTDHAYYLDAGSTVLTLIGGLRGGHYTVITSAANIAAEMAGRSECNVTLIGGQMSGNTLSCSGPQAEQMLSGMNIDVAVMATSGYSPSSGFTSGCLSEAQLKQQVIKKAAFTIMLMDYGKLGRSQPFTFASLDEVDILVGDRLLHADFIKTAETHGIRVFSSMDGLTPGERSDIMGKLFAEKYR